MVRDFKRLFFIVVILVIVLLLFINIKYSIEYERKEASNLVIYGDNISTNYKPFVENGGMYLSIDTISKTIDENIYYDKVATKVIVTTYMDVVKFKIDENKMSKNFEYFDISTPAKLVGGQPFVNVNILKDIYGVKVDYSEETNTITIDKLDTSDIPVKYNKVKVYSDVSTTSGVLQTLNTNNTVTVYTESLKHNRWYKIKTDSGVVGYISKNNVDIITEEDNKENEVATVNTQEKLTMFWQYGSNLSTLGTTKIDGVNVVSPTWYELKNSKGDISSKYSAEYYQKAKSYGYNIWPIITNGIDSTSYTPDDTSKMMNSEYNRELFIKNLLELAKKDKIDGINMDFEAMKDADKDLYTQLIRELAPMLRRINVKLSVDMYFVSYISRSRVGAACDYVVLMGYDQRGGWSNEPGSIAEVSWVEGNVKSLIEDSKIPANKIILGVPFYTRLWTQKAGDTGKPSSKIYTMADCQAFLKNNNLTTIWDEDAGQNFAQCVIGDLTYKLWLEDSDSIKKRVETVNKYGLAGITGWRKGLETNDIWTTIKNNLK